jgi:hypothetical protein
MTTFIATNQKIAVENYPYGFTLRTTLFDEMEFNPKKGFRHVTTTINPKNGGLNKSKKSTYFEGLVRYYDENNHIKTIALSFNGDKETNKAIKFINENFDLFTSKEIEYFYAMAIQSSRIAMRSKITYCGAKFEDLKPLFDEFVNAMVKGFKNPTENHFNIQLDIEKIEACSVKDYQPFKVTSY